MDLDIKELQKLLNKAADNIPEQLSKIVEVEGMAFIAKNFKDQGFNEGNTINKWKARATTNRSGRDITRYRTNRVGRAGSFNKYGRKIQNRAILVGHKSGGNTLKNSFRARRSIKEVRFTTYKPYAEAHNEGLGHQKKRQFIGRSGYLDHKIKDKLTRVLDSHFK